MLTWIDEEIRAITAAIRALIARHADLQTNFDLLLSIPSIGEVTAAVILAELPNIAEFTPKGLAAFAGLSPQEQFGFSKGPALCRIGSRRDRLIRAPQPFGSLIALSEARSREISAGQRSYRAADNQAVSRTGR